MGQLHLAEARCTPAYAQQFAPALARLEEALRARPGLLSRSPARRAAVELFSPVSRMLRRAGLVVVSSEGLELLEYMRRRGVLAGGTAFGDYLEGEIMDHVFRNTAIFAAPANVYVALYTTATTDAGGGTEVSGGAYARVGVGTTSGWSGAAGSGATDNVADVNFGTATANWGTVSHVAIRDALTLGNLLFHGALSASKVVNNGDSFKFAIGALDVSLD